MSTVGLKTDQDINDLITKVRSSIAAELNVPITK